MSLLRASPYNLRPPSEDTYNFSSPTLSYGQHGQAKFLDMVVFKVVPQKVPSEGS